MAARSRIARPRGVPRQGRTRRRGWIRHPTRGRRRARASRHRSAASARGRWGKAGFGWRGRPRVEDRGGRDPTCASGASLARAGVCASRLVPSCRRSATVRSPLSSIPCPGHPPAREPAWVRAPCRSPRWILGTCSAPPARTNAGRGQVGAPAPVWPDAVSDGATPVCPRQTTPAFVKQRARALRCRHARLGRRGGAQGGTPASRQRSCLSPPVRLAARRWVGRGPAAGQTRSVSAAGPAGFRCSASCGRGPWGRDASGRCR
jgi:hypothetical protein